MYTRDVLSPHHLHGTTVLANSPSLLNIDSGCSNSFYTSSWKKRRTVIMIYLVQFQTTLAGPPNTDTNLLTITYATTPPTDADLQCIKPKILSIISLCTQRNYSKKRKTGNTYKIQYITLLTFLLLYSNLLCILITENSQYLQHEYSLFLCQHITTLMRKVSAYTLICNKNNIISYQIQNLQVLPTCKFIGTFLLP